MINPRRMQERRSTDKDKAALFWHSLLPGAISLALYPAAVLTAHQRGVSATELGFIAATPLAAYVLSLQLLERLPQFYSGYADIGARGGAALAILALMAPSEGWQFIVLSAIIGAGIAISGGRDISAVYSVARNTQRGWVAHPTNLAWLIGIALAAVLYATSQAALIFVLAALAMAASAAPSTLAFVRSGYAPTHEPDEVSEDGFGYWTIPLLAVAGGSQALIVLFFAGSGYDQEHVCLAYLVCLLWLIAAAPFWSLMQGGSFEAYRVLPLMLASGSITVLAMLTEFSAQVLDISLFGLALGFLGSARQTQASLGQINDESCSQQMCLLAQAAGCAAAGPLVSMVGLTGALQAWGLGLALASVLAALSASLAMASRRGQIN